MGCRAELKIHTHTHILIYCKSVFRTNRLVAFSHTETDPDNMEA